MEVLHNIVSWGSPLGIGLFNLLSLVGLGVFFWGLARFNKSSAKE